MKRNLSFLNEDIENNNSNTSVNNKTDTSKNNEEIAISFPEWSIKPKNSMIIRVKRHG